MLRGLYTAAAGMITQQHRHDTVTNNISNINTAGYKQTNVVARSFPEMLIALTGVKGDNGGQIGRLNTGVIAEESLAVHVQGDLVQTNRMSDFAIVSDIPVPGVAFDASGKFVSPDGQVTFQPQALFTVQNGAGDILFTRGGSFSADEQGYVVTNDGFQVLNEDGTPLRLPAGVSMDQLLLNGRDLVNSQTGDIVGRLLVTRVDEPYQLVRDGNGYFRFMGDANSLNPVGDEDLVQISQGYIERSNVDPAQSMVEMMSALRAYEANQKVVQFYDRSLDKAVNEIGRV